MPSILLVVLIYHSMFRYTHLGLFIAAVVLLNTYSHFYLLVQISRSYFYYKKMTVCQIIEMLLTFFRIKSIEMKM